MASLKSGITSVQELIAKAKARRSQLRLLGQRLGEPSRRWSNCAARPASSSPTCRSRAMPTPTSRCRAAISSSCRMRSPARSAPVRSGKVTAIGIADTTRSPYLPDLPTVIEQGLPGVRRGRLDRPVGTGQRAGADPRQAECRDAEDPEGARGRGEAEGPHLHARRQIAPGVRATTSKPRSPSGAASSRRQASGSTRRACSAKSPLNAGSGFGPPEPLMDCGSSSKRSGSGSRAPSQLGRDAEAGALDRLGDGGTSAPSGRRISPLLRSTEIGAVPAPVAARVTALTQPSQSMPVTLRMSS